jgi:hypothetical protein
MVDCAVGNYFNAGCDGGLQFLGFLYSDAEPIELSQNYPYTGLDGTCTWNSSLGLVSAMGFSLTPINSAFQLQSAI